MLFLIGYHAFMPFQYERLLHFCFSCGITMHGAYDCPIKSSSSSYPSTSSLQHGSLLRAATSSIHGGVGKHIGG